MMRAAFAISAFGLVVCAAAATAETRDCMALGPHKNPSWALLSEESRHRICAQQETLARQREDELQDERYRKRWRDAANRSVLAVTATPIAIWPIAAITPHVSDDLSTLVLMDEVLSPARDRQPEVSLGTDARRGTPRITIAGDGIAPLPAIDIGCTWSRRSIALTDFAREPRRAVASYEVGESVAGIVRSERTCHLALAGAVLPLPRELVQVVWKARQPR